MKKYNLFIISWILGILGFVSAFLDVSILTFLLCLSSYILCLYACRKSTGFTREEIKKLIVIPVLGGILSIAAFSWMYTELVGEDFFVGATLLYIILLVRVTTGMFRSLSTAQTPPVSFDPATEWKCACGRVHSSYVKVCACGKTKYPPKPTPAPAKPPKTVGLPPEAPVPLPVPAQKPKDPSKVISATVKKLLLSQLPALYLKEGNRIYRNKYIARLHNLHITTQDAEALFRFECEVLSRFPQDALTDEHYVSGWLFDLKQPLFRSYPATKEDILKEKSLTLSALCKIIDEAEWHFWNSHEKNVPEAVWEELFQWRLSGKGGEFAVRYFTAIAEETGVPIKSLAAISNENGTHLNQYKWS